MGRLVGFSGTRAWATVFVTVGETAAVLSSLVRSTRLAAPQCDRKGRREEFGGCHAQSYLLGRVGALCPKVRAEAAAGRAARFVSTAVVVVGAGGAGSARAGARRRRRGDARPAADELHQQRHHRGTRTLP